MATSNLQEAIQDRQRAIRAEENWLAAAMGQKPIHPEEDQEMGNQTVLGDLNQIMPEPKRSMLGPILATAAVCLGIPAAGAVGYFLANRKPDQVIHKSEPGIDETLRVGLGRPDELIE